MSCTPSPVSSGSLGRCLSEPSLEPSSSAALSSLARIALEQLVFIKARLVSCGDKGGREGGAGRPSVSPPPAGSSLQSWEALSFHSHICKGGARGAGGEAGRGKELVLYWRSVKGKARAPSKLQPQTKAIWGKFCL